MTALAWVIITVGPAAVATSIPVAVEAIRSAKEGEIFDADNCAGCFLGLLWPIGPPVLITRAIARAYGKKLRLMAYAKKEEERLLRETGL